MNYHRAAGLRPLTTLFCITRPAPAVCWWHQHCAHRWQRRHAGSHTPAGEWIDTCAAARTKRHHCDLLHQENSKVVHTVRLPASRSTVLTAASCPTVQRQDHHGAAQPCCARCAAGGRQCRPSHCDLPRGGHSAGPSCRCHHWVNQAPNDHPVSHYGPVDQVMIA